MNKKTCKKTVSQRLSNVQGQISGIIKMIDGGSDCIDILTQFKAAKAGMDRSFSMFLETNIRKCLKTNLSASKKNDLEKILNELIK